MGQPTYQKNWLAGLTATSSMVRTSGHTKARLSDYQTCSQIFGVSGMKGLCTHIICVDIFMYACIYIYYYIIIQIYIYIYIFVPLNKGLTFGDDESLRQPFV